MGYYADFDWNIQIVTSWDAITADLKPLCGYPVRTPEDLAELFAVDGSFLEEDVGHITGYSYGKVRDTEKIFDLLGPHLRGTVDGVGEDGNRWRDRFFGDGRWESYTGSTIYPDDPGPVDQEEA
jgi:hypothetical protein